MLKKSSDLLKKKFKAKEDILKFGKYVPIVCWNFLFFSCKRNIKKGEHLHKLRTNFDVAMKLLEK